MTTYDLGIGEPEAPQGAPGADDGAPTDPYRFDDVPLAEAPEVPEPVVRGLLASAGALVAMSPLADPDVDDHWRFTDRELDDLTPPLARVLNARPQLRAAVQRGDELTVAVQMLGYVGRNGVDGYQARTARTPKENHGLGAEDQHDPPGVARPARGPGSGIGGWIAPPTGTGVVPPET